jgi:hypothetical protein
MIPAFERAKTIQPETARTMWSALKAYGTAELQLQTFLTSALNGGARSASRPDSFNRRVKRFAFPLNKKLGQSLQLIMTLYRTQGLQPIIIITHGAEPILRSCQLCSYLRTSQHFMEPEGSLQCSQEPSNGPYSEPDQSNPYHPIPSL